MTNTKPKSRRRSPAKDAPAEVAPARGRRARLSSVAHRIASGMKTAGATASTLIGHVPGTVRATRTGAQDTTSALQTLPDSTLRWLAASSVGLSAGLRLARAPRLVVAAGALPALLAGAAIALRPVGPAAPEPAEDPSGPERSAVRP